MKEVDQRIKQRRDERIRALQEQAPYRDVRRPSPERRELRGQGKLFLQTVLSCVLLLFIYLIFQVDSATFRQAQTAIRDIMAQDFNFNDVATWYEETIGGMPAIIPTWTKNANPSGANSLQPAHWLLPLNGEVKKKYAAAHPYITIRGFQNAPVVASAEGLVAFVGEKDGWGQCVIVQHAGQFETWYGNLKTVRIKRSDWVQPQQLLGELDEVGGDVQFAVKRGGEFVDPLDVIARD